MNNEQIHLYRIRICWDINRDRHGLRGQNIPGQARRVESTDRGGASNIELIKTLATEGDKGNMDIFNKVYAPDSKFYFPSNNPKPISQRR